MSTRHYRLYLVGPFRMEDPSGAAIRIKSRKARAVLAMLGTGMNLSRSRTWIIDRLWSMSEAARAGASYRQCTHELRKALNGADTVVFAGENTLALAPKRVWVDVEDEAYLASLLQDRAERPEFLADIDVRDPEFEHWVRDLRTALDKQFDAMGDTRQDNRPHAPNLRPILISERGLNAGKTGTLHNRMLQSLISKSIDETGAIKVMDADAMHSLERWEADVALRLRTFAAGDADDVQLGASLTREGDGTIVGDAFRGLRPGSRPIEADFDFIDLVNETVHRALDEIATLGSRIPDADLSAALCLNALRSLEEYSAPTLAKADKLIGEPRRM
ncbi:MAG: hypothetical protein AAF281_14175 [Pseudomonadota bacterium]